MSIWNKKFTFNIIQLLKKEDGQSLMEYATILFFVVIVVIVALTLFSNQILALWQNFVNAF